jgi:hypothetical protein
LQRHALRGWRPLRKCPKNVEDLLGNDYRVEELIGKYPDKSIVLLGAFPSICPESRCSNKKNPQDRVATNSKPALLCICQAVSVHFLEAPCGC